MGAATIKAQQRRRIKVIRLSNNRSSMVQMCGKSDTSAERQLKCRCSSKTRVIEKLSPVATRPVKSKTRSPSLNTSSHAGTGLVSDIIGIFKLNKATKLRTQSILDALSADPDKPWATICSGQAITARRLGSMLKPYGIRSRDLKFETGAYKGYKSEWFTEVRQRG